MLSGAGVLLLGGLGEKLDGSVKARLHYLTMCWVETKPIDVHAYTNRLLRSNQIVSRGGGGVKSPIHFYCVLQGRRKELFKGGGGGRFKC